jgi:hypothetical protein
MTAAPPWEAFLEACFPAYLLPESFVRALPEDAAARLLARIGGRPGAIALLRAASVVAAHEGAIHRFALDELPSLARSLAPRASIERRPSPGELRGRLDVPATLRRRVEGHPADLVTRAPRRDGDRPEDVLVKSVAARLSGVLRDLVDAGLAGGSGWAASLRACARGLESALASTPLRDVAGEPITAAHEDAARGARDPVHALALRLHRAMREGLDETDPDRVARTVAEGALAPGDDHTRFELAVLLRLIQALEARLAGRGDRWDLRRSLVIPGRREIAELAGERGGSVRVYYDQACLAPGPYDAGLRRYLGQRGRLRPDVTVVVRAPDGAERAVVIEAKLSADPGYLAQGFREATLYGVEYGAALSGWPKAILVAPGPVAGAPRAGDEVIAVGWDDWVPEVVADGMLAGV